MKKIKPMSFLCIKSNEINFFVHTNDIFDEKNSKTKKEIITLKKNIILLFFKEENYGKNLSNKMKMNKEFKKLVDNTCIRYFYYDNKILKRMYMLGDEHKENNLYHFVSTEKKQ